MTIGNTCSTISSPFLIPVTSKPRLFKVTTSNIWKLKNYGTFLSWILFILYDMTIGNTCSTISNHFLIPVTSKQRLFKVTTSNIWKLKNYGTFLSWILFILYDMTIGNTCSTISSHFLIPVSSVVKRILSSPAGQAGQWSSSSIDHWSTLVKNNLHQVTVSS